MAGGWHSVVVPGEVSAGILTGGILSTHQLILDLLPSEEARALETV